MSWNDSKALNDSGGNGGGLFIKLPQDGDSVTVVLRGAPYSYRAYWDNALGHSVVLDDGQEPPADAKAKIQHKINAYSVDDNDTKIMQLNQVTFEQISDIRDELGEAAFDLAKLKIKRKGTGKQTTYSVFSTGPLTADERADMDAQPLHDLTGGY